MTEIGMAVLIVGIVAFCVGWNTRRSGGKLLGTGVLLILGGMFIGIGGNPAKGMPNGSPGMVALGFVVTGFGIIMMFIQLGKAKSTGKERALQAVENKKIEFYNECVKNGIRECRSEKEIQKITLIAQNHKMQYSDISSLFYDAKASLEKDEQNKESAEIKAKKEEECEQCNSLNKYYKLSGRDKRIAMLSAEREEALASAKALRDGAAALMHASQQKEHDWAVHGGIASGIAGPIAGVATAMDIQAKNAAIRAQNEANRAALAPIMMTSYSGAGDYTQRAAGLLEEMETTKTKLVSNDDAKTCLSKLAFSKTKVQVSETGTCTVTTSAKLESPYIIFGDVEAIVDGTIIAKIYDGEELVGAASLVLPTYGIKAETELKGMCLYCGTPGKQYTVEFAAINLWAMER